MKRILFAAAFAALAASAEGGGWVRTETALGPGVTRIDLRRETPPCDVRMVAFDRSALPDLRFHVRQAGGGLFAAKAVPALARELEGFLAPFGARRIVAGANGDFFDNGRGSATFGMPFGTVVSGSVAIGGELVTTGHYKPGILYAEPDLMLYEWRDRADRRELRLGRLVFRGEILSHPLAGGAVTNAFRLVNPLLAGLDPDPAKQPDELVVLTARWTKPIPACAIGAAPARTRRPGSSRPTGAAASWRSSVPSSRATGFPAIRSRARSSGSGAPPKPPGRCSAPARRRTSARRTSSAAAGRTSCCTRTSSATPAWARISSW